MGFAAASRCHVANRSLSKTPTRRGDDEEEESRAFRWLNSYFDGAQHERRAGFAGNSKILHPAFQHSPLFYSAFDIRHSPFPKNFLRSPHPMLYVAAQEPNIYHPLAGVQRRS